MSERGSALLKYALVFALVAAVGILAVTTLGDRAVDTIVALGRKIAAAGGD